MFPALADQWYEQVQAQRDWRDFQAQDFQRLRRDYGVDWVVLQRGSRVDFSCPYQNDVVMVCRIG